MAYDSIQGVSTTTPNITPNFSTAYQPGLMCTTSSPALSAQFEPTNDQSGTFGSYAKYAVNRFLDVAEPIGTAIGNGTDAILNEVVKVGDWWTGVKETGATANYLPAAVGGAADQVERYAENVGKYRPGFSGLKTAASVVSKGLNMTTGALDVMEGYAKDVHQGGLGWNTIKATSKCLLTIGAGAAVGATIFGTFTLAPAIVLGAAAGVGVQYLVNHLG